MKSRFRNHRGVPGHTFARIPPMSRPRSRFDRSSTHITSMNANTLVPLFVDEVLPGDTYNMKLSLVARFATLEFPIMDSLSIRIHSFFVPNRLVWQHFEAFFGQQEPDTYTDYIIPTATSPATGGYAVSSLQDYMGIVPGVGGLVLNNLPMRAYNLIWNYWYRDQNLQNSVTVDQGDGPDDPAKYTLLPVNKYHDYFTSCLPFVQKGPAVSIPIGTSAPVYGDGKSLGLTDGTTNFGLKGISVGGQYASSADQTAYNVAPGTTTTSLAAPGFNLAMGVVESGESGLYADLTTATAATINELRLAITMQQFYELNARGGTRYPEFVNAHFGAYVPDARVQWPEYLGGTSFPLQTHVVPQTSESDHSGTPQGDLAAYATAGGVKSLFNKSFVEHGYVFVLASIRSNLTYQQGVEAMWYRSVMFDIYDPIFAKIGEQPVYNREIYVQGTSVDNEVFGYNEAWASYRYKPSRVSGLLRSTATLPDATLDSWHLAQFFTSLPALNPAFIVDNPPIARVVAYDPAVPATPAFIVDSHFKLFCTRVMPVFGTPGLKRL